MPRNRKRVGVFFKTTQFNIKNYEQDRDFRKLHGIP